MPDLEIPSQICKVSDELGLVFGWAIVCKKDGQDYYDLQGDHIPELAMLKAATDFMAHSRTAKDMHKADGELPGTVLFAFPMTEDIAKSFGIETTQTGLMIAMKPEDDEILAKFKSGEYTGFSIGGKAVKSEDVTNA